MDKCHKHIADLKTPDAKQFTHYSFIYINSKQAKQLQHWVLSVMFEVAVILRGNLCSTWDTNNVSFLQDAYIKYVHFLKIQ